MFTIVLILVGAGSVLYMLGVLIETLVEGRLTREFGRRRMHKELMQLHDHVIVAGWGQVGESIVNSLYEAGEQVVIVDRSQDIPEDHYRVVGDATEDDVLREAGIERAKALIVALNSDASVRALKGAGRPHNPLADRAVVVGALGCVDLVTSFEELDFYPGVEYRTLRATHALKQVLRAGVTSIAAPGGIWNINVALRDAVNAKLIEGPRIAAGGHYLSTYNGIGSIWPSQIEHPKSSFSVICNTREEFIKQARKEIKDGVDILKVAGDGDSLTAAGQLAGSISLEELQAVAAKLGAIMLARMYCPRKNRSTSRFAASGSSVRSSRVSWGQAKYTTTASAA